MSFLSRLFGAKKSEPSEGADVEARLAELEQQAEKARPGYVGSALNRAGDLALKSDQPDRAVRFYGRAIDAFLDDAQRELARGVANKIIRVRPTAIRTLCTITWLDLAARHQASALMHLRDYVTGADAAGQQARAATQIYLMAEISPDSEFIDAVADALDALNYPRRAKEVRGWIAMGAPQSVDDSIELSDRCMQAAVRSNDKDIPMLVDNPGVEDVGGETEADTEAHAEAEAYAEAEVEADAAPESEALADEAVAGEAAPAEETGNDDSGGDEAGSDEAGSDESGGDETAGEALDAEDESAPAAKKGKSGKSGKSKKKRKKKR